MPSLPLRLHPTDVPLPVCAGWLPEADVARWLEEAGRIEEAASAAVVRFYPVAAAPQDQSAAGVILHVSGTVPDLDRLFGPRVQRLGEAAPGVLVPVRSGWNTALTDAERQRLFPWHLQFLHPTRGLTGFEERDALLPWQLLTVPAPVRGGWFAAVPGPLPPPPLRLLTMVQELSLGDMLRDGGEDIASRRPDQIGPLPGPGLPDKVAGYAAGALGALGAAVFGIFGNRKAAAALERWSQRWQEDLGERRRKELNQLLDRFGKDLPDALRHAIPLAGAESRRGLPATPGWKLGARDPHLNPFSQGGSGPVDVWNIDNDTRLKLEKCYRDAAAREAAAGHYSRAAYIHGGLLGDWNRAAEMLEKAGRVREAARIYTERLRSGVRAAQCLEKAGLLAEAAVLYQEAGQHEKAGDLLARIGQEEAARIQWEIALRFLTNPLEKALLLEKKLADPDHALTVLRAAWPSSGQALPCFEAWAALLGRLGRHGEMTACLELIERSPDHGLQPASNMVTGLQKLHSDYPDAAIRDHAATLALRLAGQALSSPCARPETKRLLDLLPGFAPGDRLLARDAGRFTLAKHPPPVPLLTQSQTVTLRADQVIQLDPDIKWESITHGFHRDYDPHVLGWSPVWTEEKHYVSPVAGGILHGQAPQRITWPGFPHGPPRFFHLVMEAPIPSIAVHSGTGRSAAWKEGSGMPCKASALALGPRGRGEFILLRQMETESLTAEYYGPDGQLRRSRVLDFAPPDVASADWFIGGHGADLWIAGMNVVCRVTGADESHHNALDGPVTALAVAPPVLPSQAMVVSATEAVLLIAHGAGKPIECVNLFSGSGAHPPVVAFTNDGRAIVADAAGGLVWQVRGNALKQADIVIPPDSGQLIAATATGTRGFAFLTSTGKVLCYGR